MSKQKDAPAFDFYPERWLVGTASLSDLEQICYLRLLCHQWVMEGLPADVGALKRLAGKGVTDTVLAKLPVCEDGKRRNNRLEIVRNEQRIRIEKSRAKIQRMNEARTGKNKEKAPLQEPLQEGLQEPLVGALQGPPHHSPLTTHPVIRHSPARESAEIPPISLEAVKANCGQYGATPECAEQWWLTCDARGWVDERGQKITNPLSHLGKFKNSWNANEAQRKKSHGNDSRPNRPPVTRNVAPLDPNRPSLNATAVNAPKAGSAGGLEADGGPGLDFDGKGGW